ncbi:MAG: helix-turn-helix transcriptional regulator [Lachnospiraceae bacterium]|nr:helix-turn-helix transcriptional regulator [Lachnospiraceae bacterium]
MLYENIKRECKKKGVSISKVESELNFSRSSICKWNDNEPGVNKVKSVADYLGVSIDYLLEADVKQAV